MTFQTEQPGAWSARVNRNTALMAAWTAAWVAATALAAFGPAAWDHRDVATALAIGFSLLVGIGMLLSHRRYLQSLDELERSIQLQAMAWALGAGLIGGVAYALLAEEDIISAEPEIAHLLMFMSIVYALGFVAGRWRYR